MRYQRLRAVDEGPSRAEIIDLFQVSRATIKWYVKQRRETGTVLPRPIPGRPLRKEAALQMGMQELLEVHPDASQKESCHWWETDPGEQIITPQQVLPRIQAPCYRFRFFLRDW